MRLPRPRFLVRWLMLVVAIAGLAMGGGVWGYRMRELSDKYKGMANSQWNDVEGLLRVLDDKKFGVRDAERLAALVAHHTSVAQKYERAACYPWLRVELPDRPEPWWPEPQPRPPAVNPSMK
jgi:hypothetical protein